MVTLQREVPMSTVRIASDKVAQPRRFVDRKRKTHLLVVAREVADLGTDSGGFFASNHAGHPARDLTHLAFVQAEARAFLRAQPQALRAGRPRELDGIDDQAG